MRSGFAADPRFSDLEFAFDAGGMVRCGDERGKVYPAQRPHHGKNMKKARKVAERILAQVKGIDGVVDARIIQRLDYPQYVLEVDQAKASASG